MEDLAMEHNCSNYNIYHWSKAEVIQYNNVKKYHKIHKLPNLNFIDILDIFKKEPITIKGLFNYGLKNVAEKMYEHNMINTIWDDKNIDGKEVMIYAWSCNDISKKTNKKISSMPLMKEIIKYNYYDCKVLNEIMNYIRKNMI